MGHALKRRQVITGGALALVGVVAHPAPVIAEPNAEISRSEESIRKRMGVAPCGARIFTCGV